MKHVFLFTRVPALTAGFLALLIGSSAAMGQQQIVYEREFSMISGEDNTLRIVVNADGDVSIDRPAFMTHAGEHRGTISASAWSELKLVMDGIDFDSRSLAEDIALRSRNELFYVSDPELSRFSLLDGDRAPLKEVQVESLKAYAERYSDQRLEQLRGLELQLLELMNEVIEGGAS